MSTQIEATVKDVLRRCPQSVGFYDSIGKHHVGPILFEKLSRLIGGRVKVKVANLPNKYGAYNPGSNTITLRGNYTHIIKRNAIIIHESVHCLQDWFKASIMLPFNEIAANVAENQFRRFARQYWGFSASPPTGAIDIAADKVAERLEQSEDKVISYGDPDINKLVDALMASNYKKRAGEYTLRNRGL